MLFPSLVNKPDSTKTVPTVGEKMAYGVSDFASQLMYCPIGVFLMYYYTNVVHVNIATVATLILCSRLLDGVSDIVMGLLIDKTKSPYGKSRAWLLRSIIPFFIALTALFAVPVSASETVKLIYIFISYNFAVTVVFTAMNVPYGALSTTMTNDSYQRSIIAIFRMICAAAGIVFVNAVTLPMVSFFGDTPMAWTYTFACMAILGCVLIFVTFAFCYERFPATSEQAAEVANMSIKDQIKSLVHNRYWLMLSSIILFVYMGDTIYNTANIYFCQYYLDDRNVVGNFNVAINVCKIVAMVTAVPFCVKHFGKAKSLAAATLIILGSFLIRYIFPQSIPANYVSAIMVGLSYGFIYACLFAMIPDTVEYGEYSEGKRQEGLVFSGSSFAMKFAAGIGTVVAGFVMDATGFDSSISTQSEGALEGILLTSTIIPVLFFAVAFVICMFYRLDKMYPEIIKTLTRRRQDALNAKAQTQAQTQN
ncbi:MAG: glycoside-pentoside-hexuronide (GPH):cation symporter [Candidatus Anaerobiospirillum pullicola]|uniref:Glycoside-pentoside-hexuronide (GPH):cation symporter n=1 Tax=Candidatus Anaerobiospirillum pullicola TaxID=2838451 RepID=A0A948TH59_9GAMM|nr:glycoside-pentoside-hexuronide (GPH):cation symporter [Candidatus Anaerobiospirillum pullicola]